MIKHPMFIERFNKAVKIRLPKLRFCNFLIIITSILTAVIFVSLSVTLYDTTENFIVKKKNSISMTEFRYIVSNVEKNINEILNIAGCLQNNEKLMKSIDFIEKEDTNIYDQGLMEEYIQSFLAYMKEYNSNIQSIAVCTRKGHYTSGPLLFSTELRNSIDFGSGDKLKIQYVHRKVESIPGNYNDKILYDFDSVSYFRCGIFKNLNFYGYLYIILKEDFFSKFIFDTKNVFIFDNDFNIIFKGESDFNPRDLIINHNNYSGFYETNKYDIYAKKISYNDMTVAYIAERRFIYEQLNRIRNLLLVVSAISLLCSVLFSKFFSRIIIKPFEDFAGIVRKYRLMKDDTLPENIESAKDRFSLREKIFFYFIGSISIPVSLFIILYYNQSSSMMFRQVTEGYNNVFEMTGESLSGYFSKKFMIFNRIIYDKPAQQCFVDNSDENRRMFFYDLKNNMYLGLDYDVISLYGLDNTLLASSSMDPESRIDDKYFSLLVDAGKKYFWQVGVDKINNPVLKMGTKVTSFLGVNRLTNYVGYAVLSIKYNDITSMFSNLANDYTSVYISDSAGAGILESNRVNNDNISFNGDSGMIKTIADGTDFLVFYKELEKTSWYLVARYNYGELTKQSNMVFTNNIYIFIIIFLVTLLLSYYISFILLKPVNKLNSVIGAFRPDKDILNELDEFFIYEVDDLRVNFNKMVERIEDLFDELMMANFKRNEIELEKKNSEMIALQAQINPHFLYNTLDSVMYMVRNGMNDRAVDVISSLSRLFRFGISRSDKIITIREEVEYAKAYANILSIRHDDNIRFEWKVNPLLLKYKTIKLILQPIIENAVYHGLDESLKNGAISIECVEKCDDIHFTIADNGKGIDGEKLEVIRKDLLNDDIGNRIGIFNVQSRLKLYYGNEYGLGIESEYGKGTTVTIVIPKEL